MPTKEGHLSFDATSKLRRVQPHASAKSLRDSTEIGLISVSSVVHPYIS